jgi:hypothetical protein
MHTKPVLHRIQKQERKLFFFHEQIHHFQTPITRVVVVGPERH